MSFVQFGIFDPDEKVKDHSATRNSRGTKSRRKANMFGQRVSAIECNLILVCYLAVHFFWGGVTLILHACLIPKTDSASDSKLILLWSRLPVGGKDHFFINAWYQRLAQHYASHQELQYDIAQPFPIPLANRNYSRDAKSESTHGLPLHKHHPADHLQIGQT